MQTIKAIITDDELKAQTLLKALLEEYCPDVEVVDSCSDLPNAIKYIKKHKPNLVFLDIEMPGHSGLELLDFFNEDEIDFSIVFTTAYNQHSIHAIKMAAFDYLLKPIEPDELIKTIDRYKKKFENEAKEFELNFVNNKIAVPTSDGLKFISTDEIIHIKADGSYSEIHLITKEKILVSRTLKNFEDTLKNSPNFFRCSKSHIINFYFINEYIKSDGGFFIMKDNSNIPISPNKVASFIELSAVVKR